MAEDYIQEQKDRESDCSVQARNTLLAWAAGSGAVYGGITYALHMFYAPVRRIDFRFKVIPVCMATLGTAYYRSEVVMNDCRREYVRRSYQDELGGRSAAFAQLKRQQQAAQQAHAEAAQHRAAAHHPHHNTTTTTTVTTQETKPSTPQDSTTAKAEHK